MRPRALIVGAAGAAGALALLAGCGSGRSPAGAPPPTPAEAAALRVFDVARHEPLDPAAVGALSGRAAPELPALLDLLRGIPPGAEPHVVRSEPLGPDGVVVVDLGVELPGGGHQDWSVHVAPTGDGAFAVTAVFGPDAAWPSRRRPRDGGLSIQPPG